MKSMPTGITKKVKKKNTHKCLRVLHRVLIEIEHSIEHWWQPPQNQKYLNQNQIKSKISVAH
jgi:hypothetical protein